MPIAYHLEEEEENESFSTLSATILGASEVIFSGLGKQNPELIVCDSSDSILLIKEVGTNAVLSILGEAGKKEEIKKDMDDMISEIDVIEKASEIKEVLEK